MEYILLLLVFIILILLLGLQICNRKEALVYGGYGRKKNNNVQSLDRGIMEYYKKETNTNYVTNNITYGPYTAGNETKSWQDYDSWTKLQYSNAWNNYISDRNHARKNFLFDWTLVLKEVVPMVNNKTEEYIGIIKAKSDKKTLYIDKIESSNDKSSTDSYFRSVPAELVAKYMKFPGYFLFHTHPNHADGDPLPSDIDIFSALHHALDKHYIGEVVISSYGIIIYYLNDSRYEKIDKEGGKLAFYTFCYDVVMSWNSINSIERIRIQDRLKLLNNFGITMEIIPSYKYISDNHTKDITPKILCDRFINTKYEILEVIKELVKREEYKESKGLKSRKKISSSYKK